jgi:hypothetical protein
MLGVQNSHTIPFGKQEQTFSIFTPGSKKAVTGIKIKLRNETIIPTRRYA